MQFNFYESYHVKLKSKKMKTLIFLTILGVGTSSLLRAQDNVKHKAQPDSIIKIIPFDAGRNTGYLYTIGGKLATREDVAIRLLAFTPSAMEYHAAKNNIAWTWVSFSGFAVTSFAAGVEFGRNSKNAGVTSAFVNGQPEFIYQHHNLTGAYILTGAATAFLTSSIINFARAAFHANRSIQLYNQQYQ
jgi:hypothetical protein